MPLLPFVEVLRIGIRGRFSSVGQHTVGMRCEVRPDALTTRSGAAAPLPAEALPTLTPEQIARVALFGRRRTTARDDILLEPGDKAVPTFLVVSGELQVVLPSNGAYTAVVTYRPGQFSGEVNAI